ncbi:MAG TPA: TolC family protein [Bryobacteraceae bacterium]|nr:TolC family protein [Bryobacteraceae bacterium]
MRVLLALSLLAWPGAAEEPPLVLRDAVQLAVAHHQDVAKAKASAEALKGKIREVRSQALPDVKFALDATRWRDPSLLNASGINNFPDYLQQALIPSAVNLFDYSLTVKQPLFTQGKIGTALRLANIEAEGALSEIDRAEQDVALATVKAFYGLLWAEQSRSLVVETQEQKKLHAEMARTRYRNGVATEVDVLRSEVAVANGQPDLVRAENAIKQARAELNYYLGRPLDFATRLAGNFQEMPWEQNDLTELTNDAMRRRPEIERLRIAERSASTQLELARAEDRIRMDFTGSYGLMARLPQNLVNSEFIRWSAGINFTFPVFDGFKRSGLVTQALASQRIARLDREKFEQQVRLAIQQAYDDLRSAQESIAAAKATVSEAERVLAMMQDNYKYGAATTLDIADAETAVSVARGNLLRGLYDYSASRANLRWSIGQTPWE